MTTNIYEIFPELTHPITFPEGETEASLLDYLGGFRLDDADENELENYLRQDIRRFVYTLNLLPEEQRGALLEIGANPYFTSLLLKKYSDYELYFTNYFGPDEADLVKQVQVNEDCDEIHEFGYLHYNIDEEDLPYEDKFEVVLFCEVIEHLIHDPMQAILRIKKALKQDGTLILSTPNVNRLENVAKMIAGANIYDPYSGYGIYGRHNREYNKHELFLLLSHCGFEIEDMFTSDVNFNRSNGYYPVEKFAENILGIEHRKLDLGQYIFLRARNARPAKEGRPFWLFRSYSQEEICD